MSTFSTIHGNTEPACRSESPFIAADPKIDSNELNPRKAGHRLTYSAASDCHPPDVLIVRRMESPKSMANTLRTLILETPKTRKIPAAGDTFTYLLKNDGSDLPQVADAAFWEKMEIVGDQDLVNVDEW